MTWITKVAPGSKPMPCASGGYEIQIAYSEGNPVTDFAQSHQYDGTPEHLARIVDARVAQASSIATVRSLVAPGATIPRVVPTPPPAPDGADVARDLFFADLLTLETMKRLVAAGAMKDTDPALATQAAKVKAGYDPSYAGVV